MRAWRCVLLLLCCGCWLWSAEQAPTTEEAPDTPTVPAEVTSDDFPAEAQPASSAADPVTGEDPGAGKVGYIEIDGPIDRHRERYFDRTIDAARQQGLDTVVMRINSDGGEVFIAREMLKRALDQHVDGPRLIAFVDFRAISAGAMLAYACDEIHLTRTASIGDIGVIFIGPEGMEYAPEKFEAPVRTLLTQAAEIRGWPKGPLLKMTARNQILYEVRLDDRTDYVIQDDWPSYLADHPKVDPENQQQVVEFRGEDRLLTLTGQEAVDLGMATSLVADLEAVYTDLGVDPASVVDLSPTGTEELAWTLDGFTGLLLGLALLFIFLELKTPGVGLWATLGAIAGVLFLFTTYALDILNHLELLLLVLGMGLIAADILLGWGGGMLALLGALVLGVGTFMALLPNDAGFDFSDPRFTTAAGDATLQFLAALGVGSLGFVVLISVAPHLGIVRRLAVQSEVAGTSAGEIESHAERLVGRRAEVVAGLHPSGSVILDGDHHSAHAEHGSHIPAGRIVEVIDIRFGELVVRPVPEEPQPPSDSEAAT